MIMLELTFLLYLAIIIVSLYGFSLFLWWWIRTKHASEVYKYVMILFLAISFDFIFAFIARVLFVTKAYIYNDFLTSFMWTIRSLPLLIILFTIVFRMTNRVRSTLNNNTSAEKIDDSNDPSELIFSASGNVDNPLEGSNGKTCQSAKD